MIRLLTGMYSAKNSAFQFDFERHGATGTASSDKPRFDKRPRLPCSSREARHFVEQAAGLQTLRSIAAPIAGAALPDILRYRCRCRAIVRGRTE